jgi:hypothetical protein
MLSRARSTTLVNDAISDRTKVCCIEWPGRVYLAHQVIRGLWTTAKIHSCGSCEFSSCCSCGPGDHHTSDNTVATSAELQILQAHTNEQPDHSHRRTSSHAISNATRISTRPLANPTCALPLHPRTASSSAPTCSTQPPHRHGDPLVQESPNMQ